MASPGSSTPVQIAPDWWMAYAPSGHAYYHNTATKETTWTAPDVSSAPSSKALDQQAMASYYASSGGGGAPNGGSTPATGLGSTSPMGGGCGGAATNGVPSMGAAAPMASAGGGSCGGCGGCNGGSGSTSGSTAPSGSGTSASGDGSTVTTTKGDVKKQVTPACNGAPEITVQGTGHIPAPWTTFNVVQLPRNLLEPMLSAGFQSPTAIQQHSWPILTTGRDVIGVAKTGSGKTLSFLLPGFTKMLQERLSGSPIMLVMAPTRELAVQIDQDAKKFGGPAGIVTALAYGGAPKGDQLRELRKRPHLLTGTPGRLNDFLEGRMINLNDVRFLVLDEADRMLDMGFEPQIRKVIGQVPTRRQTLMFTATWPKEVRKMASDFFHDPIEIRIGDVDSLQANADIEQTVFICNHSRDKEQHLINSLRSADGQAIVFTGTKKMCDQLARTLERTGLRCEAIHGDRDQAARDRALGAFKSGQVKILVATDVAARGLDVKAVTLVVNFDPANNAEDYVHRIGRTGRAGAKGHAITFLGHDDGRKAAEIAQVMQRTGKPVPPELERLAGSALPKRERNRSRSRSRRGRRGRSRSRSRSRGRGRDSGGSSAMGSSSALGGGPGMGGPAMGGHPMAGGMPPMGGGCMPMGGMPPLGGIPMQGGFNPGAPMMHMGMPMAAHPMAMGYRPF